MSVSVEIRKSVPNFELEMAFEAGNEHLGLLGASGCGKSMTLRCIAGVETPDEGRIVVDETVFFDSAAKINMSPQRRKTALLFQNYMLFPNMTVQENVASGLDKALSKDERRRIVGEKLAMFDLVGFEKRMPGKLSGGQQQRVALARMLAAEPGILMLDEPFSALDSHLKSALEQNMKGVFEGFGGTVLYVSHDIDEALRFCDRIAVIDHGRITELDSSDRIVAHPNSLASIRLSGCKNVTAAVARSAHEVWLPEWGILVESDEPVPREVAYLGIRAFYLERAEGAGRNSFRVAVDQTNDSRFERTAMLRFLDAAPDEQAIDDDEVAEEATRFFRTRLQWRVDKLVPNQGRLPEKGDELYIHLPSDKMYLVTC